MFPCRGKGASSYSRARKRQDLLGGQRGKKHEIRTFGLLFGFLVLTRCLVSVDWSGIGTIGEATPPRVACKQL